MRQPQPQRHKVDSKEQNIPHRIDGRYRVAGHIGSGSFATVYKVLNIVNCQIYAVKLEPLTDGRSSFVEREAEVLQQLSKDSSTGIPRAHWFGREKNFDALVLDLLGPSLQDLLKKRIRFNPITVQYIGKQLLLRLQYIHARGFIHSDIQPQNILVGLDDTMTIFLADFGLARPYRHPATGQHLPFRDQRGLNGTPAFVSINSHLGGELGRRDDLEALVYVLVYLLSGSLPWLQTTHAKKPLKLSKVLTLKQTTAVDQLCTKHNLPQLSDMLLYTRMLAFSETPDYDYLQSLLRTAHPQPLDEVQIIKEDLCQPYPLVCADAAACQRVLTRGTPRARLRHNVHLAQV